jgi:hypothetical protein
LKNSLWYEVLLEFCLYWIYLNFNDIYPNNLLFLKSEKSIICIWYSTFNKLTLFEDFNYRNGGFRVNKIRFYMSYTNGHTIWQNYTLTFIFICSLVRFLILVDVTSAYDLTIINFSIFASKNVLMTFSHHKWNKFKTFIFQIFRCFHERWALSLFITI